MNKNNRWLSNTARKHLHTLLTSFSVVFIVTTLLALHGCDSLANALPPTPSPFPAFPRLPTVTPEPPTPTASPTFPPIYIPATSTPEPIYGTVTVGANVRSGPSLDQAVVDVIVAGEQVILLGKYESWYQVMHPDTPGITGWMSAELIEVDPESSEAVPSVTP